jgi:HAD superfamily phosphoserine phosphatase-like hydrolase
MSIQDVHAKIFDRIFHGRSSDSLRKHIISFLDYKLDTIVNPLLIERLRQAQSENHVVVILSSSPDFLVESIGSRLGADISVGTCYQTNVKMHFTQISQVINGEEKAEYVTQLSNAKDVPLENVIAYSDSYLDLPLLERVGKAVVVNPDKKLRSVAINRKWEIVE